MIKFWNRPVVWPFTALIVGIYWLALGIALPWLFQILKAAWQPGAPKSTLWLLAIGIWFGACYLLWAPRLDKKATRDYRIRDLCSDILDVLALVTLFGLPVLDPDQKAAGSRQISIVLFLSSLPAVSNLVAYGILQSRTGGLPEIALGVSVVGAFMVVQSPSDALSIGWLALVGLFLLLIAYETQLVDWSRP